MKGTIVVLLLLCISSAYCLSSHDTYVVMGLKHTNLQAAEDLLFNEISNNLHPNYGKYLSQEEIGKLFGPTEESLSIVNEWLNSVEEAYDITVSPSNDWISFHVPNKNNELLVKEENLFQENESLLNEHLDIFRVFVKGEEPQLLTRSAPNNKWMDLSLQESLEKENTQEKELVPHFSYFRTSSNSVHFVAIPLFTSNLQKKLYGQESSIEKIILSSSVKDSPAKSLVEYKPNEPSENVFNCVKCKSISKSIEYEAILLNKYCSSLPSDQLICFSKEMTAEELVPFPRLTLHKKGQLLVTFSIQISFFNGVETPFISLSNSINENEIFVSFAQDAPEMDPNTQRSVYGIPSNLVGTNPNNKQMVWGTGSYGISLNDMAQFYQINQVNSTTQYVQDLGLLGNPNGSNWVEATLDAQYISGIAPQVLTTCLNTDNNTNAEASTGFGDALVLFALGMSLDPTPPLMISMSLGSLNWDSCNILCTQVAALNVSSYSYCLNFVQNQYQACMYSSAEQVNRINQEFMFMGLRGITLFGAAGDGGNHFSFGAWIAIGENGTLARTLNQISCNYSMPTYPASSQYVTAIGGLQMESTSTPGVYYPIGCSSQTGGVITGGCGFSWMFPMPSYQQSFVSSYLTSLPANTPLGLFNSSGRAYPDFSGISSSVPIVVNGAVEDVYGTSCSTPETAGLFSLINDYRLNAGLSPLGFINTRLYQAAVTQANQMFVDVTEGISSCGTDICCDNGFPASLGWDVFTGFGNPTFSTLLSILGSD